MNDRVLLEAAARAIGKRVVCTEAELHGCEEGGSGVMLEGVQEPWNPLHDDGDALRLAVAVGISPDRCMQIVIDSEICRTGARHTDRGGKYDSLEEHGADPYAATRRAIVLAAALAKEPA